MSASIRFAHDQYNDLRKENDDMKVEIKMLKEENSKQNQEMKIIKNQINRIQQDGLNKTLICFGLKHDPKVENIPILSVIFH